MAASEVNLFISSTHEQLHERFDTSTHEFVLVEHLHERLRDELVEPGQERVDLRLDGASHAQFRHQLRVLVLKQAKLAQL